MKSNKGFTLIELLAVIVILAIIALITVPVVINIINNAKKGAAEDSTYGVIEAAKLFWVSNQASAGFESENPTIVFTYDSEGSKWKVTGPTGCALIGEELEVGGTKPNAGTITITSGTVSITGLKYGDYTCKTEGEKAVCEKAA